MPELLAHRRAARRLRRGRRSVGISLRARRRPVARAARPQRHGQDHAGQLDRRRDALSSAARSGLDGRDITPLRAGPARACRRRLGAAGAQHLQVAHRGGEPHRGGAAGPVDRRDSVYAHVPAARASVGGNLGNQLSGGEQQMLAIGRALMLNPRIIAARRAARRPRADHRRRAARGAEAHHPRRGCSPPFWSSRTPRRSCGVTDRAVDHRARRPSCTRATAPRSIWRPRRPRHLSGVTDAGTRRRGDDLRTARAGQRPRT